MRTLHLEEPKPPGVLIVSIIIHLMSSWPKNHNHRPYQNQRHNHNQHQSQGDDKKGGKFVDYGRLYIF